MTEETLTIHAIISGRVQGVWFRAWTQEQANKLGVDGWVRNRTDGTVEAVMSGPRQKVEALLALCRKGPMLARVDGVRSQPWGDVPAPGFAKLASV